MVRGCPLVAILFGDRPWSPRGLLKKSRLLDVRFAVPDDGERRNLWEAASRGFQLAGDVDLGAIASKFRLTQGQIQDALAAAQGRVSLLSPGSGLITSRDLDAACRAQSSEKLSTLARKIEPRHLWNDIVLPEEVLGQLREICQRVVYRHRVLSDWGFGAKLSLGKGVNALFAGPSGTGKTMATEIIASELGLDLYKIDLSGVVSKYIGETERNLDRVFSAAEDANAILFFDEADALFGKRSEVRDSHDRYANIEISYLLQKMEEYEGLAILATNLKANLDEAFTRRLAFTIHFPFPDDASRLRIWRGIWPPSMSLDSGVDLEFLAEQFKLSGGNIKNIALAAAFLAAECNSLVTMAHLLHATRREFQKLGKPVGVDQLGPYAIREDSV
jgi:SpoVK/Ycf46/Vps4 family AAA+-type ATPase